MEFEEVLFVFPEESLFYAIQLSVSTTVRPLLKESRYLWNRILLNEWVLHPHIQCTFWNHSAEVFKALSPHESGKQICGFKTVRIRVNGALIVIVFKCTPSLSSTNFSGGGGGGGGKVRVMFIWVYCNSQHISISS